MAPVSMFLQLVCLLSALYSSCCGLEKFTISRTTSSSYDVFVVPTSKCGDKQPQCGSYSNANDNDPTRCRCACRYEYSTFSYYGGAWTCLGNDEIRQQASCQFRFEGKAERDPVKVLMAGSTHKAILPSGLCSIDLSLSRFYRCNGTRGSDLLNSSPKPFTALALPERINSGINANKYRYTLKIGAATSLVGRVVILHFKCRRASDSSCLIFKMAGDLHCPIYDPQVTQSPVLPTDQNPDTTRTMTPTNQNPVTINPSPNHSTEKPTSDSTTKSPGPKERNPNSDQQNGGSTGTIVAVIIVVIIVIIIVAALGFALWKRKRGENVWFLDRFTNIVRKIKSSPPKTSKKPQPREESIYEEIQEQPIQLKFKGTKTNSPTKGIYSYAFEDSESAYTEPAREHVDDESLYEEAGTVIQGGILHTDEQGYAVPADSPVYNILEGPEDHSGHDYVFKAEQSDNKDVKKGEKGGADNVAGAPQVGPKRYDNVSCNKQRRRPPSPPRQRNGALQSGNVSGNPLEPGYKANSQGVNDMNRQKNIAHAYEDLTDNCNTRPVYEQLDRDVLSGKC